ncbi:hypothetical protein K504DRAFT_426227 [Pleomassaria siparia CBS 279.74]|uniref:Uncharacterized protein n=1 Tax=Pleomassaria siparia CBS 279.74 TaxID=1314801 RepID=A0A6G1KIL5_9PLEO|nr:hypothetical protein K504DRAFT_426227 [Pleomassaria siparia CBS 279.74]
MAQDNNGMTLELAQFLQTLANATPQIQQNQQSTYIQQNQPSSYIQQNQQSSYDPTQLLSNQPDVSNRSTTPPAPVSYGYGQSQDPRLNGWPPMQHRQPPPVPQYRTPTPTIDVSTIIEWKHGLRCVNKIASHNPNFVASVQKLMKDQEQNVKNWAAGRDRLNEEHVAQRENEQKFRAAVSLPGVLEGTVPMRTPEREQEEHDRYTRKVYRASQQMAESHSNLLKGLGVPFFGVKPELVIVEDPNSPESQPAEKVSGKITKKEVLELQRKMLNHLVEMYGD